jgi:hypothetical protein
MPTDPYEAFTAEDERREMNGMQDGLQSALQNVILYTGAMLELLLREQANPTTGKSDMRDDRERMIAELRQHIATLREGLARCEAEGARDRSHPSR